MARAALPGDEPRNRPRRASLEPPRMLRNRSRSAPRPMIPFGPRRPCSRCSGGSDAGGDGAAQRGG
eukprot:12004571-Alexandrium_andersonii.AAC.1